MNTPHRAHIPRTKFSKKGNQVRVLHLLNPLPTMVPAFNGVFHHWKEWFWINVYAINSPHMAITVHQWDIDSWSIFPHCSPPLQIVAMRAKCGDGLLPSTSRDILLNCFRDKREKKNKIKAQLGVRKLWNGRVHLELVLTSFLNNI